MNAIDYFDHGWQLGGDSACLIQGETGRVYTYSQLRSMNLRVANALRAEGFNEGAKAAVISPNLAEAYACVLGIYRAGVTYVALNPRNADETNYELLRAFGCEVLFFTKTFASLVDSVRKELPSIRLICIDAEYANAATLDEWITDRPETDCDLFHDPERVYALQPTGGTTGFPKAAQIPNRGIEFIVATMMATAPALTDGSRPVFLAAAPLTHAAGYFMQYVMLQGGSGVLLSKADPETILDAIEKYKITHLFLPPTVIYMLLAQSSVRERDYSSLRYLFYGASPMSPDKLREAITVFGPVLFQVYGQTETGFGVTYLPPSDHFVNGDIAPPERLMTCGRQGPFSKVAIMDNEGRLLPDGEVGEVVVRGLGLMTGYYKNPEATEEVWRHGWHRTGDIGYRDLEGFYYIVDRMKDMIISGGFNIFSIEVESALSAHPAVQECAVIGAPDPKWGEQVKGVVVLRPGAMATAEDLIHFCRERIGGMKAPKSVEVVDALPRNSIGKILKRELRKKYWVDSNRQVS